MERILNRIIELRKAKKISQKQIAEHLEISQAAYAKVESGTSITVDRLFKIAELLNVHIGDLLDIEAKDSDLNKKLYLEIEQLKKRIIELEEQLNDKRSIIQFLSANDLLFDVAIALDVQSGEYHERRAKNTLDDMLNGTEIKPPYDRENRESLVKYISERIKNWPGPQNK